MKNGEEMQELIEMCFDPKSPANAKLKKLCWNYCKKIKNNFLYMTISVKFFMV